MPTFRPGDRVEVKVSAATDWEPATVREALTPPDHPAWYTVEVDGDGIRRWLLPARWVRPAPDPADAPHVVTSPPE